MSEFTRLSQQLEEAIAAPISVLGGGPAPHHAAPNAADVDLETTKDYSELLNQPGVEASTEPAEPVIDLDGTEELENEDETNWVSDTLDEAGMSLQGMGKIVASMLNAPTLAKRVEAVIKQSGVKDSEEVKTIGKAFQEALMVHLMSVVPLAMRDVGVEVASSRVGKAQRQLKKTAMGESRGQERTLSRLARELEEVIG